MYAYINQVASNNNNLPAHPQRPQAMAKLLQSTQDQIQPLPF